MKRSKLLALTLLSSLFLLGNNFNSLANIPGIDGTGAVNYPYKLNYTNYTTALQKLNKIAKWVNKNTSGDDGWDGVWTSTGKYFELSTDISGFTGTIGTSYSPFMGTFDGNSHRIDINISKTNDYNAGLFGKAKNAIIKNLTVSGTVTGVSYVAGIVAQASNVWIEHCTNLANVTANENVAIVMPPGPPDISYSTRYSFSMIYGQCVGGIVGSGDANGVVIEKCANAGQITGGSFVGGIIGNGSNNAEVFGCINIGTVRGGSDVGGIAGYAANTIENSLNGGFVAGGGNTTGGITGDCGTMASCTVIRHCLNTGVVHGYGASSIAGYMPNTTNAIDNFYDKQMSSKGGINGNDIANRAEGKLTLELTGNNLSAWSTFWTINTYTYITAPLYPTPKEVGNLRYFVGSKYDNGHLDHVAAVTLILSSIDVADYVLNDFYTHTWQNVTWTAQLGNIKINGTNNTSSFTDGTVWDVSTTGYIGDTMIATCYGYSKEVPIYIPMAIYKTATETNYITNTFSIGEVTPNIVTSNATIDIQTSTEGNLNVSIYDLAGTKVANVTDKFVSANTSLLVDLNNLSNLSAGSYMAVVAVGKEVVMRKFVKG